MSLSFFSRQGCRTYKTTLLTQFYQFTSVRIFSDSSYVKSIVTWLIMQRSRERVRSPWRGRGNKLLSCKDVWNNPPLLFTFKETCSSAILVQSVMQPGFVPTADGYSNNPPPAPGFPGYKAQTFIDGLAAACWLKRRNMLLVSASVALPQSITSSAY